MFDDVLDNPTEYIVLGLVMAFLLAAIYNIVKGYYSHYSIYKRSLKTRRELAEKSNDSAAIQQLNLEDKWLETVESIHRREKFSISSMNKSQSEIDIEMAKIYKAIPAEDLRLPGVNNKSAKKHDVEMFMGSIIYDSEELVYTDNSVLPYPISYLIYALNYVLTDCPRSKEVPIANMIKRLNVLMSKV
jgi:hypothetical protein